MCMHHTFMDAGMHDQWDDSLCTIYSMHMTICPYHLHTSHLCGARQEKRRYNESPCALGEATCESWIKHFHQKGLSFTWLQRLITIAQLSSTTSISMLCIVYNVACHKYLAHTNANLAPRCRKAISPHVHIKMQSYLYVMSLYIYTVYIYIFLPIPFNFRSNTRLSKKTVPRSENS